MEKERTLYKIRAGAAVKIVGILISEFVDFGFKRLKQPHRLSELIYSEKNQISGLNFQNALACFSPLPTFF